MWYFKLLPPYPLDEDMADREYEQAGSLIRQWGVLAASNAVTATAAIITTLSRYINYTYHNSKIFMIKPQ